MAKDEMVGWHHQLDVHEFEQVPGVGDGHGSLACCSLWGCNMTERLNGLTDYLQCQEEHRLQFLLFFLDVLSQALSTVAEKLLCININMYNTYVLENRIFCLKKMTF